MFSFKKKYFLIIESIKEIDLRNIKIHNKFNIIYRIKHLKDNINDLKKFRNQCRLTHTNFYIANDIKLATLLKADGVYLSSSNKSLKILDLKKLNFDIIGSAHNIKEIALKKKQGCSFIILSKLFLVDYDKSSSFYGITKFNKFITNVSKKLIPLGGIKASNLNSLKIINSEGFTMLSEIKKKPTKIISRLF